MKQLIYFLLALALSSLTLSSPMPSSPTTLPQTEPTRIPQEMRNLTDFVELGPLPYEELKLEVAKFKQGRGNKVPRQSGGWIGLYFCEHYDFQGACYWSQYVHIILREEATGINSSMDTRVYANLP